MISVIFAVILCYGIALALFGMTLVNPWWIVALSIVFAGISVFFFRNKKNWSVLTGTSSVTINVLCHLVTATGLFMALILGVNYFCRDTSRTVTVRAGVVRVYSAANVWRVTATPEENPIKSISWMQDSRTGASANGQFQYSDTTAMPGIVTGINLTAWICISLPVPWVWKSWNADSHIFI